MYVFMFLALYKQAGCYKWSVHICLIVENNLISVNKNPHNNQMYEAVTLQVLFPSTNKLEYFLLMC